MRSNTDRKPSRLAPVLAALGTILVVFILVGTMLWAFLSAGRADTIAVGVMALYGVVGLAVVGGVLAALIQRLREIKRGRKRMPKNIDPGQRAQKKDARKGAAFLPWSSWPWHCSCCGADPSWPDWRGWTGCGCSC